MNEVEKKDSFLSIYADLFSTVTKESFVQKFAASVIAATGRSVSSESFIKKVRNFFTRITPSIDIRENGISISARIEQGASINYVIQDIFDSLERYLKANNKRCLLVFDEFQEITEIPESKEIEGLLREKLQATRSISCFFVGSRRRILQEMFTDKRRPFYKMTMLLKLGKIEKDALVDYVREKFVETGKQCPREIAEEIYEAVDGYTCYVQKLSHLIWDNTETTVTSNTFNKAVKELLELESTDFQGVWSGLGRTEKRLLLALSRRPTGNIYGSSFLSDHRLSVGAVQKGIKQLIAKDIVETGEPKVYQLTDPLLAKWCRTSQTSFLS